MKPGSILGFVMFLFAQRPDPDPDGFGQSLSEDCRYYLRWRQCRKMPVQWRHPLPADRETWDSHPLVGRFAEDLLALADVDGRVWIVKDRMWFGWPDPPQYAFLVMDRDTVWAVADFSRWPANWLLPPFAP